MDKQAKRLVNFLIYANRLLSFDGDGGGGDAGKTLHNKSTQCKMSTSARLYSCPHRDFETAPKYQCAMRRSIHYYSTILVQGCQLKKKIRHVSQ